MTSPTLLLKNNLLGTCLPFKPAPFFRAKKLLNAVFEINQLKFEKNKGVYTNNVGGRGVRQMSTLLYNPYLVKVATKGGGGSKISKKWFVYAP